MWFQTQMQSIACLTESSTSGRASPSHWDSEEQSLALKEVRTHRFIQPKSNVQVHDIKEEMYTYNMILSVDVCVFVPPAEREAEVLYEVLFDEEFAGGLNIR